MPGRLVSHKATKARSCRDGREAAFSLHAAPDRNEGRKSGLAAASQLFRGFVALWLCAKRKIQTCRVRTKLPVRTISSAISASSARIFPFPDGKQHVNIAVAPAKAGAACGLTRPRPRKPTAAPAFAGATV